MQVGSNPPHEVMLYPYYSWLQPDECYPLKQDLGLPSVTLLSRLHIWLWSSTKNYN